jgi:hypothetical protein
VSYSCLLQRCQSLINQFEHIFWHWFAGRWAAAAAAVTVVSAAEGLQLDEELVQRSDATCRRDVLLLLLLLASTLVPLLLLLLLLLDLLWLLRWLLFLTAQAALRTSNEARRQT